MTTLRASKLTIFSIAPRWRRIATHLIAGLILFNVYVIAAEPAAAESIKIGMLKTAGGAPAFIGMDRGYFAAEGLTAEPVFFGTGQPVATAVVSGAIDFGATGLTAPLYTLASEGALRIIGGAYRDASGFHGGGALVVSNRAFEAGLTSLKEFPGHSFAVPGIGAPGHYNLVLVAEKYGFDVKTMRLLQLQSNANQVSAVVGGQADLASIPGLIVLPAIERGDVKLLAWAGDETPWQLGAIFASTTTAKDRYNVVERFLRAYKKGAQDYYDAFVGPDGKRKDAATAPEILALMSKYIALPPDMVSSGLNYIDPELRLDVQDVLHQIAWYRSQGMVKPGIDDDQIIDKRYVIPLPEH